MRLMIRRRSYGVPCVAGFLVAASATITWGAFSSGWLSPPSSRECWCAVQRAHSIEAACSRRVVLIPAGLLAAASGAQPASAYERFDWLSQRKKDPLAAERWGRGGTMSEAAVQQAAASLTPLQRYVLLEGGVEDDTDGRRFVNGYEWDNTESGVYVSAISGVPLFSSRDKMEDPRIGWPGFRAPIDRQRLVVRSDPRDGVSVEVLDRASMTHLGHILSTDGHYCINAASLRFIPTEAVRAATP
mmetsp:Transcript_126106/g.251825  ORF Transcript_126106/g.251825 Transcript_126106/m.251825 type:complete len:244 (-) Transcript_126106:63-794(-)